MQTELVRRAMHGDHDAFAQLADGAWEKLYGTAGLILRDDGLVQDAMQAALIRAWRDLPTLRDPERFDAWLYRIAVNRLPRRGATPPAWPRARARRGRLRAARARRRPGVAGGAR